ncbi:MAG: lysine exporter LysO family protein, partial [Bacteroidales bacterium]|nr:lysine exporter LysO family protein [Bacteroidales bacterium]
NVTREILTLILAPILVKYFGKIAPITSGGATSMDTTLPIIVKVSGKEYLIMSLLNGIILTISVPFIIGFIYNTF